MNKIILVIIFLNPIYILAQDSYRNKNYDEKIYLYQMNYVEENNISQDDYLKYSKSLSKWDSRPLLISEVWIMDELQPSSIVPNFFWGSFSRYYKIDIKDAMELPQIFLKNAKNERLKYIDDFSLLKENFERLVSLIGKTDKKIFLNQSSLQRVDNLFFENGKYWKYLLPEDSPYPMSDSTIAIDNINYTELEKSILTSLEELGIYAIYNSDNSIYFIIDGLLDNSFGYLFLKEDNKISSNHLFEINYKTQIAPKYYFYVAN